MSCLKYTPGLFFLFFTIAVQAQLKLGEEYLENGQYEEAFQAFEREDGNEDDIVQALFWMGKIYAEPGYEGYNLDSAYHYANRARSLYGKLSNGKQKRLDKNEVGSRAMSGLRNAAADSALAQINRNPSLEAYERFLNYYERCRRTIKEAALEGALVLVGKKARTSDNLSELAQ